MSEVKRLLSMPNHIVGLAEHEMIRNIWKTLYIYNVYTKKQMKTHTYIYICIHMCVCALGLNNMVNFSDR